ncbi:FHA domain-containing protein [Nonomuraea sediminis]|uniref:FHA domain-containing protein n=1 Tax=Nonomuraea sediminis TaxID=2835864 RepID=UPI001BDC36DC|nr:FHA domain-containing protein [Nonomuraea sediminis]
MATCPQGHPSGSDDYCDVCGAQIGGAPAPQASTPPPADAELCPVCQTPRAGQFCEVCGHDFSGASAPVQFQPPTVGVRWEAVTAADRTYYEKIVAEGGPDAAAMQFPHYCPERSFALAGPEVRIGRRSKARGLQPEIDLSGPPEDPGVSHLHAVLLEQPDGSWLLVDPGSANGTQVNGRVLPINQPVPVGPGDRIHVGAWTVITIREGTP